MGQKTILLRITPSPSIETSTTSPSVSHLGGFMPRATPPGVPVRIIDPFSSVVPWLTNATISRTPNTRSDVFESWRISPFTLVWIGRLSAAPRTYRQWSADFPDYHYYGQSNALTLGETIIGPTGAKLSKPLEKHHCGMLPANFGSRCHVLAETSFATVYPATYSRAFWEEISFPSFPITIACSQISNAV